MAASFEVDPQAYSSVPTLSDPATMKLLFRSVSLVLARIGQKLPSLQRSLEGWAPQRAPVLVPIPIRTDRRAREPVSRHPYRGG